MRSNQRMASSSKTRAPSIRRGSMFVETAIGITLAVLVMIGVAQLVALSAKQRREVAQTRLATEQVANTIERVMVLPWDELSNETVGTLEISNELARQLDEPQLSINIDTSDGDLSTKKIEVALSWKDQATRRVKPVRVVTWRHKAVTREAGDSE